MHSFADPVHSQPEPAAASPSHRHTPSSQRAAASPAADLDIDAPPRKSARSETHDCAYSPRLPSPTSDATRSPAPVPLPSRTPAGGAPHFPSFVSPAAERAAADACALGFVTPLKQITSTATVASPPSTPVKRRLSPPVSPLTEEPLASEARVLVFDDDDAAAVSATTDDALPAATHAAHRVETDFVNVGTGARITVSASSVAQAHAFIAALDATTTIIDGPATAAVAPEPPRDSTLHTDNLEVLRSHALAWMAFAAQRRSQRASHAALSGATDDDESVCPAGDDSARHTPLPHVVSVRVSPVATASIGLSDGSNL